MDEEYEANEKYVAERRTEFDNLLQMKAMPLEQKVDILQLRPKPVRDRIQKQLDAELNRILKITVLEIQADDAPYRHPLDTKLRAAINWRSAQTMIETLKKGLRSKT